MSSTVESGPPGQGSLQVTDVSAIPAEPPPELFYHHKAGALFVSKETVGTSGDHLHAR